MSDKQKTGTEEGRLQNILVQGWTGMMFVFLMMIVTDIYLYGTVGKLEEFAQDLGDYAPLLQLFCFNVLMQISIRIFYARYFRWFVFMASTFYFMFFVWHQIFHILRGEPPISLHTYLDLSHHVIGGCTVIFAYKWAKHSGETESYDPEQIGAINC
jgi:hypothetical protein